MKKKQTIIVIFALLFVLLLGILTFVGLKSGKDNGKTETSKEAVDETVTMFSDWTNIEIFADVPAMLGKDTKVGSASDYGNKNYLLDVNGASVDEYKAYLTLLEEQGFVKHSDNGEEGMEGHVFTASYTRENKVITVSHLVKYSKTYISVSEDLALSPYLNYSADYVKNNVEGAKTKVHMLQLNDNGNSFVIQLKNGHFIIEDGGQEADAPYLLDYLESLTPDGEKPVIEAWFMTHAHGDHYGALKKILNNPKDIERLYVEGFYFVEPSKQILEMFTGENPTQAIWFINNAAKSFKTSTGEMAKMYRPQLGQRYYFCDMYIDIPLTMEQFITNTYHTADFNDTSTWLMHYIDGQKFLHAGDAGVTSTKTAMSFYDESYFELDVFSVLHHGINVYDYFTDFCTLKTILYTNWQEASLWVNTSKPNMLQYALKEENAHLQEAAAESLSHGDGTVVLSFPYEVGEAEILPSLDWKYSMNKRPVRQNRD